MERKSSCRLPLRYPDISEISPDPRIAALLYESYAGKNGSLATISNYIYQSIMFKNAAPIVSELLDCILLTEMQHFKMLGETILLLGANPSIKVQIKGNYIDNQKDIMPNLEKTLLSNVEREKIAAAYYNKIVLHTKDNDLVLFLKRLAADKEHHAKLFSDILNKIG